MTDLDTFNEKQKRYEKALTEANARNKETLFKALAESGITSVTIEFDGEGDDGQMQSVLAFCGEERAAFPAIRVPLAQLSWHESEPRVAELDISEAVTDLCYDFLSQRHDGWENNEGAFGTFIFDVAARTIELEFNGRYCDIDTSTYTF